MRKKRKILIVSAHPDDEILGCGATIARLVKDGWEAYTLILGEGVTSRDIKRDVQKRKREIEKLKKKALRANEIIGVKEVFFFNFPDNRFDSIPLLDIIKAIEKVKLQIKPQVIFTHSETDLNIDHQITYRAVITAARPTPDESVREIYSFEILSSTEWRYPINFSPDLFYDISDTIEIKIKAISMYKDELRKFPHPRSIEGIRINAKGWGMKVGLKYAEAFKSIRVVR